MTIEVSDEPCPDCGECLQVIYVTELKQVVSGWACPDCGYLASEKHGFEDRIPKASPREYVLRIEKPLTGDDVSKLSGDIVEEFNARASADMADDEVWLLIDPEDDSLVDVRAGDDVTESD
jgi:hypothetical protein